MYVCQNLAKRVVTTAFFKQQKVIKTKCSTKG